MVTKNFPLLSIIFLILCCGNGNTTTTNTNKTQQEETISAKAIKRLNYRDYGLSEEAENAVKNWEKYQELAIQINYLKKADLSFFMAESTALQEFMAIFMQQRPKLLETNPIDSRIVVLETKIMLLQQVLKKDRATVQNKIEHIKEVLTAFSNLNDIINKKLERDLYDSIQPN